MAAWPPKDLPSADLTAIEVDDRLNVKGIHGSSKTKPTKRLPAEFFKILQHENVAPDTNGDEHGWIRLSAVAKTPQHCKAHGCQQWPHSRGAAAKNIQTLSARP